MEQKQEQEQEQDQEQEQEQEQPTWLLGESMTPGRPGRKLERLSFIFLAGERVVEGCNGTMVKW